MNIRVEFLSHVSLQDFTTINSDVQRLDREIISPEPELRRVIVLGGERCYHVKDYSKDGNLIKISIYKMNKVPQFGEAYYEHPYEDSNRL